MPGLATSSWPTAGGGGALQSGLIHPVTATLNPGCSTTTSLREQGNTSLGSNYMLLPKLDKNVDKNLMVIPNIMNQIILKEIVSFIYKWERRTLGHLARGKLVHQAFTMSLLLALSGVAQTHPPPTIRQSHSYTCKFHSIISIVSFI